MRIIRFLLFNFIAKVQFNQIDRSLALSRRFKSMAADMFFSMGPFIIFMIIFENAQSILGKNWYDENLYFVAGLIIFSAILFLIINKDFYRGKSAAKRKYGYQILDVKTEIVASPLRCMFRNITCFLWPVEVIALLFNPNRRVGDFIAGTIVKDAEPELPETILDDIANPKSYANSKSVLWISLVVIILLSVLASLPEIYIFLHKALMK